MSGYKTFFVRNNVAVGNHVNVLSLNELSTLNGVKKERSLEKSESQAKCRDDKCNFIW